MAIDIILLAAAGLVTVELFVWTSITDRFTALAYTGIRSARILRRRASDHWKERAIARLWLQMMRHTAILTAAMLLVSLPTASLYLIGRVSRIRPLAAMDSGKAHLALIAGLIGYAILRRRVTRER